MRTWCCRPRAARTLCCTDFCYALGGQLRGAGGDALQPGFRNEFHAGFGQSLGRHFVIDGEYIWKYTHNAYDFSVLGNDADHVPD